MGLYVGAAGALNLAPAFFVIYSRAGSSVAGRIERLSKDADCVQFTHGAGICDVK